jgi:FdhD protein
LQALEKDSQIDESCRSLPAFKVKPVIQVTRKGAAPCTRKVLGEEPLAIRVQGKPYAVVMRTPGEEIPHVLGFCLGEGIIDAYEEINQVAFCDGADTNVVTVTLNAARLLKAAPVLERRGFISQTSCGICGKEVVRDLVQMVQPLQDDIRVNFNDLQGCMVRFSDHQKLYQATHASHAAVAFDFNFQPLAAGEDVGRHNAVDKSVGKLLISGRLGGIVGLMLSSRVSYELIQKVARARIPIVMAMSRPTSLAVELAQQLNITLICIPDDHTLLVYSAIQRLGTA